MSKSKKVKNNKKKNVSQVKNKVDTSTQEKVSVFVDTRKGVTAVLNADDPKRQAVRPFRGIDGIGDKFFVYDKGESDYLRGHIIFHHIPNFNKLSSPEQNKICAKIEDNIDVSVYQALVDYDTKNYWKTKKADEYVNAILQTVKPKRGETQEQLKAREDKLRKQALDKAGISITYRTSGLLQKSHTRLVDKYRINQMIKKTSGFVNVEKRVKSQYQTKPVRKQARTISGVKENKHKSFKLPSFTPAYMKRYTAKPGLIDRLRAKVKEADFSRTVRRRLATAGVIALAGFSLVGATKLGEGIITPNVSGDNTQMVQIHQDSVGKNLSAGAQKVYTGVLNINDDDEFAKRDSASARYEDSTQIEANVSASTNNAIKQSSDAQSIEPHEEQVVETPQETESDVELIDVSSITEDSEKSISLQKVLMATLDIGFDTEFIIPEGKYYEAPDGTGRFGRYETKDGTFKIGIVDAGESKGIYDVYKADSGKSFWEIEKESGDIFSYCIKSADGKNLYGWNPAGDNDIEQYMIQSEIERIKPFLSEDAIKFLEKTELSGKINVDKNIKVLSQIKYAQQQADAQRTGVVEKEHSER